MNKNNNSERRRHQRFPIIRNLIKPVELMLENPETVTPLPAVLFDLSGGGMGLLTFVPVETGSRLIVNVDLENFHIGPINGKVVWAISKGESWRLGIIFTKINKNDFSSINEMAKNYNDCEMKLLEGFRNICHKNCLYFSLCGKPVKLKQKSQ